MRCWWSMCSNECTDFRRSCFSPQKKQTSFSGLEHFHSKMNCFVTMSLQTRFQRSNWTGQLLCSCLSKDFRGISEKDKFVAKSFLGEQLERTRSMQNYFLRSSRKEQFCSDVLEISQNHNVVKRSHLEKQPKRTISLQEAFQRDWRIFWKGPVCCKIMFEGATDDKFVAKSLVEEFCKKKCRC